MPRQTRLALEESTLIFPAFRRMMTMQTNLSAMVAVSMPAGGERSGLTAHFLFGQDFGA
jgi:hypothetical protein